MPKVVTFNPEAFKELMKGVDTICNATKVTLGPKGRNVLIKRLYGTPISTKDGVTVANEIALPNAIQDTAAHVVKQAAAQTSSRAGDGPQPLTSKVLTPTGFVNMGDLRVGDVICGTNQTFQTVLEVHPKGDKEVFEVIFSDGRVVECCEDHLWSVTTPNKVTKALPLRDIASSSSFCRINHKGNKCYGFYTPVTVVEFESKPITIDPYLLGLLIGDGSLSGTGDIELSLGLNKAHILDKIPKHLKLTTTFSEEKNYFRVKIKDAEIKEQLKDLGLFGTLSSTKFIPELYLHNDLYTRTQLLQGLLDTDGYLNSRGLFEYSTVSDLLAFDFIDLVRGLGYSTFYRKHSRENDSDSYSHKSVHRIYQLKGYKRGNKIVEVRKTGRVVPMQCIKVSNEDRLYITDNYIVTHNTTTSMVLAQSILKAALSSSLSPIEIKREIDQEVPKLVEHLKRLSAKVDNTNVLDIATISANNDPALGNLIAEAFNYVGPTGIITMEDSKTIETYIRPVDGIRVENGFISPYFINNPDKQEVVLEQPYVVLYDGKIKAPNEIVPILTKVHEAFKKSGVKKDLLVIADEVEGQALSLMLVNSGRSGLTMAAVKAPAFGDRRLEVLKDLAVLTGAVLFSPNSSGVSLANITVDDMGEAHKVTVNRSETIIVEPKGSKELINERIAEVKAQLQLADNKYLIDKTNERLATLASKTAAIYVGASTEPELNEKKHRVDDALQATRAAIASGYLPGGGTALYRCSLITSSPILKQALKAPYHTILENAGLEIPFPEEMTYEYGVNALKGTVANLVADKIIDPTLVVIEALQNAASVATTLLLTEVTIHDENQPEQLPDDYS